jgi:hypothetical protein
MIKPGSIYSSNNHKKFVIEKIVEDNQGTWVHYQDNSRQYSCLIEAFLSRFTETTNENRK